MKTLTLIALLVAAFGLSAQEFSGRVVRNMAELRALRPLASKPMVEVLGYYAPGDGGGGLYVLTNTVAGTNAWGGRVLALGGANSWQLDSDGSVSVTQFGAMADGVTDVTSRFQAAIDFAEARGIYQVFVPNATASYRINSVTLKYASLVSPPGAFYDNAILEHIIGATNHMIIVDVQPPRAARYYAPTAGAAVTVKNFTMVGHSEANLKSPCVITAVTDRRMFTVTTANLPPAPTNPAAFPYYGWCFFYSNEGPTATSGKYIGFGLVTNINYSTGQIMLEDGSDWYATPTTSSALLPVGFRVCFSPTMTETSGFSTATMPDGASAGYCGVFITSRTNSAVSALVTVKDNNIHSFHCGIRIGSVLLPRIVGNKCKFNNFAGYAEAQPGNARDGSVDDNFIFAKYQPNYNSNESGLTETNVYDNAFFRSGAFGYYGGMTSGTATKMAVNFAVHGWFAQNLASMRVGDVLLEGCVGRSLWLDGSKFGVNNDHLHINNLTFRTFQTNQSTPGGFPTLAGYTNFVPIYYRNTQSGGSRVYVDFTSFAWLTSNNLQFPHAVNLVSTDGQLALLVVGRTNGISGAFLQPGSARPALIGRYDVNGITGVGWESSSVQMFGIPYIQNSGPGNQLRIARPDITGLEANFNLGGSIGNWTGTGLIGWSLESSGGLFLKDTDATRNTFIRTLAHGSTTQYTSLIEPLSDGTDNVVQIGGGSANAFAATRGALRAAANNSTATGTEMLRWTTTGFRAASGGVAGNPSADALLRLDSTTQGFLLPRMTTGERDAIPSPTDGLMIYNTTTSKLQVRAGGAWVDLH